MFPAEQEILPTFSGHVSDVTPYTAHPHANKELPDDLMCWVID